MSIKSASLDSCGLPRRSVQPKSNLRPHWYLFVYTSAAETQQIERIQADMKQNLPETRIVGHWIHLDALAHT
jgi:hypothetical protein